MTTVYTIKDGKETIVSIQKTDDAQLAVFNTHIKSKIPICDLITDIEDKPSLRQCWMRNTNESFRCPDMVTKSIVYQI